jgi:hypothetical protein
MVFHPRLDGGIALDGAIKSQQIGSHRRSIFAFEFMLWDTMLFRRRTSSRFEKYGFSLAEQLRVAHSSLVLA